MRKTILLLAVLMPFIAAGPSTRPALPQDAGTISLPSFGLSATSPKGWIRMAERSEGTAIKWIKPSGSRDKPPAILQLEIQVRIAPTIDGLANAIVKSNHGSISNRNATMGGARAVDFVTDADAPQKGDVHLIAGRVTEHGGYIYVLYLIGPTGAIEQDAMDSVATGIKWIDLVSPADCIAPRNAAEPIPFALFDTGISFVLPDPFRFSKVVDGREYYATFDFSNKTPDATLAVSQSATNGSTPREIESLVAKQAGCINAPTWTPAPENGNVFYSAVAARGPGKDGAAQGPVQFILIMAPKNTFGLLTFSYPSPGSEAKYGAAVQAIAGSVHATGALVTGHQKLDPPTNMK